MESEENKELLRHDNRLEWSRAAAESSKAEIGKRRDLAKSRRPKTPPSKMESTLKSPLAARLAARDEEVAAKRTTGGPAKVSIGGGAAGGTTVGKGADALSKDGGPIGKYAFDPPPNTRPVHPSDPVPSTLQLFPRSMALVEDVIIRVVYTHPDFGFRNEQMSLPNTMKVIELGNLLVSHTGLDPCKIMYAPNSPEHSEAIRNDVGAHTKQVKLEHKYQTIHEWGVRTDDCFSVRSTLVVVPKYSREALIAVKTSDWASERPGEKKTTVLAKERTLKDLSPTRGVAAASMASVGESGRRLADLSPKKGVAAAREVAEAQGGKKNRWDTS